MKKEITLGQVFTLVFGVVATIITAWVTLNRSQASMETRIENLERTNSKMEDKIDEIQRNTTAILVKLEGKEDRPSKAY